MNFGFCTAFTNPADCFCWVRQHLGMIIDQRFRAFELRAEGYTSRGIAKAVRQGGLVRLRKGQYAVTGSPAAAIHAGQLGGRVDCVSALALAGVFVRLKHPPHVQMTPHSSRQTRPPAGTVRHWRACSAPWNDLDVPLIEALAQAMCCQEAQRRCGIAGQCASPASDRSRWAR